MKKAAKKENKVELIGLDECVINALKLFIKNPILNPELENFQRLLVVGSGNALATGKILFHDKDAVFADESTYQNELNKAKDLDVCILISASGGKHAPLIAQETKKRGIKTILFTNNPNAQAIRYVDETHVFPKNPEPYTYNTSTYLSMILAKTQENPAEILKLVRKLEKTIPKDLNKYDSYYFLVPAKFDNVREMFLTKFDELFGPIISARAFTPEQTKHAKTLVESKKELFVSLGDDNQVFGKKRLNIKMPENAGYAAVLALGYYFIGKIQKQNKPYFKDGLFNYCKEASKLFGEEIKPIVE